LRVVIVEDNVDSAELMAEWLDHEGHLVTVAHSGPEGVAAIHEARPDVVVCDIGLPGMDGVEVCRTVRETMGTAAPVMVALTGWGMDKDRQRTANAGFEHHLVKPVDLVKLQSVLESVSSSLAGSARSALTGPRATRAKQ
jgi:CheY-like chemotaxis protein